MRFGFPTSNQEESFSMQVPPTPTISPLEHISPSIYEAGRKCLAKAIWYAQGDRRSLPDQPAAILGICFHTVIAASHLGNAGAESSAVREVARSLFDKQAKALYENAHPLLKLKFSTPERLPYYNLHRERAALFAAQAVGARPVERASSFETSASEQHRHTEMRLQSADGLIVGRPDYIDSNSQSVVDFKSGVATGNEPSAVSDAEKDQLRLYAYLASERGISISKGVIVRGDGHSCQIEISKGDADAVASSARTQLRAINSAIADGLPFDDLASPSAENCAMCPCIPFCEAFWRDSNPEWADQCGVHVEGRVVEISTTTVQGVPLVTLGIEPQRGTLNCVTAFVDQIPEKWLTVGGAPIPRVGEIVRVVHARHANVENDIPILRVDKALTSVWSLPIEELEKAVT